MSIKLDEAKLKSIYESDMKSKTNFSLSKTSNKNQGKQQMHLLKTYIGLSPHKTNSKKKTLIKTYNNSLLYQVRNNNKNPNLKTKKLKYNRSFEGGIIQNKVINNNNDNDYEHMNELYNFSNNNTNRKKNSSKTNRTPNFYSGNKSKTNNRISNKNNNNIIKKLDENFKKLENNIIDKKYENDIDHDEIIITTNRKTNDKSNESKNNIYIINNYIDDNLTNSSFENNKNDFKIMYVDNYSMTVPDDMLILEIKLIFEKILELQKSYHIELDNLLYHYIINKKEYKKIIFKYDIIQKKINLLTKIIQKKTREENHSCFDIYNKRNFQDINDINKNEFNIWKIMMNFEKENKYKEKMKEVFKISVFEKYYKIIKNLSEVEKKIILNLMKKNKFILPNENKMKNNKSNNVLKKFNNKKILSPITSNKNSGYLSNNKFKHKKMASYKGKK